MTLEKKGGESFEAFPKIPYLDPEFRFSGRHHQSQIAGIADETAGYYRQ